MSTIRQDVASFYPELLALPSGVTAVISPIPGQVGFILKYVSGGSLSLLPNPAVASGYSTVGSSFAVGASNLYTLGTNEILSVSGNQFLYLLATGSTCVANILRLRSAGT